MSPIVSDRDADRQGIAKQGQRLRGRDVTTWKLLIPLIANVLSQENSSVGGWPGQLGNGKIKLW